MPERTEVLLSFPTAPKKSIAWSGSARFRKCPSQNTVLLSQDGDHAIFSSFCINCTFLTWWSSTMKMETREILSLFFISPVLLYKFSFLMIHICLTDWMDEGSKYGIALTTGRQHYIVSRYFVQFWKERAQSCTENEVPFVVFSVMSVLGLNVWWSGNRNWKKEERNQKTEGFIKEVILPKGPLRDCIKYSISERLFDRFSPGKFCKILIKEFPTFLTQNQRTLRKSSH